MANRNTPTEGPDVALAGSRSGTRIAAPLVIMTTTHHSGQRGTPLFELHVAEARPRVLLAEDDDEMRALLVAGLAGDGFEVIEARDGAELLERLGALLSEPDGGNGIDLLISDVRMPFFDGMSVLAGLRRNDIATPVILITAFGDEDTHRKARALGASAVFDKPFDLNDLRTSALHFAGAR